ncbi:hypothetical protein HS1genome_1272 [Sulfodiicoccus acidiphilus]|uniref:Core-binding (CB) domain-containing protein n=1 Tax=Sulfodiicoccus acidiphilus TaxID=1670455 RepID=A0A348B3Y1_9CREN|nr:hypothetical protein [Sulfodiicoccus acidiphilus]BBD72883.1 hypothetical protein HS1genome_1272 [Sulfodiicoccus acidiphilus]GGT88260.1 hypothetical protein GCM10007116_02800 [Sulfodiicoccus acidiphilus]
MTSSCSRRLLNGKSKETAKKHYNYLIRTLGELEYTLTPDRLKEYVLDLEAENPNSARRSAKALKVFIKEVVRNRDPVIAQVLYNSFKIPQTTTTYVLFSRHSLMVSSELLPP